jgi:hypothetical protein
LDNRHLVAEVVAKHPIQDFESLFTLSFARDILKNHGFADDCPARIGERRTAENELVLAASHRQGYHLTFPAVFGVDAENARQ